MTVALTPMLATERGQAMSHQAVLDAIGADTLKALGANRPVSGLDYVRFCTQFRTGPAVDNPSVRIAVKLTLLGTFSVERGRLDRSTSEPTYRVDAQVIGLALDEVRETVVSLVVASATASAAASLDAPLDA